METGNGNNGNGNGYIDLSTKLVVVYYTNPRWVPWKRDKAAGKETAETFRANESDTHLSKRLIAKDAIGLLTKTMNLAYTYHAKVSVPTGTKGMRVIAIGEMDTYRAKMDEYIQTAMEALEEFLTEYPTWIEEAKGEYARLGKLWKASDYPSESELRRQYDMRYKFLPLPSINGLVGLVNGQADILRQSVMEEMKQIGEVSNRELWNRLYDAVAHMAERLGGTDNVFRDTLTGNIEELLGIARSLNVTNDRELEEMLKRIELRLTGIDPETLRKNRSIRLGVAREANGIANAIDSIGRRKVRL
jgi:hypothetical protein